MTPETLTRLEALCESATDGPWAVTSSMGYICLGPHVVTSEDAEFIDAARMALPKLLARVRELEAEVDGLEDDLVDARGFDG